MKVPLSLAVLAMLLPAALVPTATATAAPPMVCTYDLIESIAVCVGTDSQGRACVVLYVGPSTPVNRCLDPRQVIEVFDLCAEPAAYDVGVCVTTPDDYVCVTGHWGHYPFEECVYVGASTQASAVDVKAYCRVGEPECVGYLACVYETKATPRVCVPDPCYTTHCWSADAESTLVAPSRCLDRYWAADIVVGRIVSRSSCEYEVCTYHDDTCRDLLA